MSRTAGVDEAVRAATFVIVPARDEAARIGPVLVGLRDWPNVVVVDDGSVDGTQEVARPLARHVVRHRLNRGQGAALQTGLELALARGARWLVTFDADGQHDPAAIPTLLAPLLAGRADVALGSRFLGHAPGLRAGRRRWLKLGVAFTWLFAGVRLTDAHNGLRALTATAAATIELTLDRMAHASQLIEQVHRQRLRWVEVPVDVSYPADPRRTAGSAGRAVSVAAEYLLGGLLR